MILDAKQKQENYFSGFRHRVTEKSGEAPLRGAGSLEWAQMGRDHHGSGCGSYS